MPRYDDDDNPREDAPSLLSIVAPAAEHLVNAIGEIAAAGQAVIDAVPEGTRRRYSRTLAVGGTALGFLGSIAKSAAGAARSRSRERARKEALAEIAAALDAHADRVAPPAAKAIRAVREVISPERTKASAPPAEKKRSGAKRSATARAPREGRTRAKREGTRAGIQRELDQIRQSDE